VLRLLERVLRCDPAQQRGNAVLIKRVSLLYALSVVFAFFSLGCSRPEQPPRVVKVTMKKYEIHPSEIRVGRGESVQLEVSTTDVQHGFDVPDLGISESIQPGRPALVAVNTDQAGAFVIACGIICGPMHDDMRGRILIE
jgi:heme/copper-type cytochrome/quinol oxidase subunit 2